MSRKKDFEIARRLAPEDIRGGMFVCISRVVVEGDPCSDNGSVLRLAGYVAPLLVVSVCVPYVIAIDPDEDLIYLDVRRHRLVEVARDFGRAAFALAKKRRAGKNLVK